MPKLAAVNRGFLKKLHVEHGVARRALPPGERAEQDHGEPERDRIVGAAQPSVGASMMP